MSTYSLLSVRTTLYSRFINSFTRWRDITQPPKLLPLTSQTKLTLTVALTLTGLKIARVFFVCSMQQFAFVFFFSAWSSSRSASGNNIAGVG